MSDFFAMGGYGAYVWSAFGFALLVLLGLLIQSWSMARRREREFAQLRAVARPETAGRTGVRRAARRPAPDPTTLPAGAGE